MVPLALGGREMGGNPSVSQVGAAKWVEPTPSYFLLSNQGAQPAQCKNLGRVGREGLRSPPGDTLVGHMLGSKHPLH